MKRKYIHIEIVNGALHIWADNKAWDSKTVTLKSLDEDGFFGDVNAETNLKIKIPVVDFLK